VKTIIVTGASGFIGRRLVKKLTAEGCRVICPLRPTSSAAELDDPLIRVVRGDLTDRTFVDSLFDGASVVYHLAAMVSDWGTVTEIRKANVDVTSTLLASAERASIERFVHVSSTDIYGHPGGKAVDEDNPPSPGHFNWYAETKRQAEQCVKTSRVPWVIARPATVYGPGSVSMIAELVQALKDGFMLTVNGGRTIAGLVYVDDVVDGLILAADHKAAVGESFNLSHSNEVTWKQCIDDLARAMDYRYRTINLPRPVGHLLGGGMELGYRFARKLTGCRCRALLSRQAIQIMGVDQHFSHAKATHLLGYQARVGYEEGLSSTLEWIKATRVKKCGA
jgi:nucleoside-diphosphate-sugar epimerase